MPTTRSILLLFILLVLCTAGIAQSYPDSAMSQAWVLGSKLSVAGALHAQPGNNADFVNQQFTKASDAAKTFGLKLPPLPAKKGNKIDDSASVLFYLINTVGNPIGNGLAKEYGAEHAAVFEVALKANMLFILYGADDSTTNTVAGVIRSRSARASYLGSLTGPLLQKIDQRASYDLIKKELFELNDLAPKFIALLEFTRDGDTKYSAGDYAGSAAAYTRGLAVNPSDIMCYNGRGRANLKLRKNPEAIADYTKAIEIGIRERDTTRNLGVSYTNRGIAYVISGKNELAMADLNKAISLQPDYAGAYKVRGLLYKQMGNAKLSAADLQKAEQLQPGITK